MFTHHNKLKLFLLSVLYIAIVLSFGAFYYQIKYSKEARTIAALSESIDEEKLSLPRKTGLYITILSVEQNGLNVVYTMDIDTDLAKKNNYTFFTVQETQRQLCDIYKSKIARNIKYTHIFNRLDGSLYAKLRINKSTCQNLIE